MLHPVPQADRQEMTEIVCQVSRKLIPTTAEEVVDQEDTTTTSTSKTNIPQREMQISPLIQQK